MFRKGDAYEVEIVDHHTIQAMPAIAHPGRLLGRELEERGLSTNHPALELGVPSGCIMDILNGRRSITAEVTLRLGRYFGNDPGSGWSCRISTILPWSRPSAARRSRGA